MGAKASDKVLVTGQLMYLVDRLRNIQEFRIARNILMIKINVAGIGKSLKKIVQILGLILGVLL